MSRARHWFAAALAAVLLLTMVAAPVTGLDMVAMAHATAGTDAPSHMAGVMGDMAGPCCDGTGTRACEGSALCMAACGKLPLQLAAAPGFVPVELVLKSVREPDIGRTDLFPSPLRRPPRVV